jgi:hypothetical protein
MVDTEFRCLATLNLSEIPCAVGQHDLKTEFVLDSAFGLAPSFLFPEWKLLDVFFCRTQGSRRKVSRNGGRKRRRRRSPTRRIRRVPSQPGSLRKETTQTPNRSVRPNFNFPKQSDRSFPPSFCYLLSSSRFLKKKRQNFGENYTNQIWKF